MITGTGLLAGSLKPIDRNDCVFFCSGVSNSAETDLHAFQREIDLLNRQDRSKKLVYFSTVSVFNPSKSNSPYIRHKLEIEDQVRASFPDYLILRLPNMVGSSGNPANLFPFLHKAILEHRLVTIHQNAKRHLLSADRLPQIVNLLLEKNAFGVLNVSYGKPPLVKDVYLLMCQLLNREPHYISGEPEPDFEVDNADFLNLIRHSQVMSGYSWQEEVKKYISASGQS